MYKYFWECFYHLEPEDNHPHIPKEMLARYFKHTHTHTTKQPNKQVYQLLEKVYSQSIRRYRFCFSMFFLYIMFVDIFYFVRGSCIRITVVLFVDSQLRGLKDRFKVIGKDGLWQNSGLITSVQSLSYLFPGTPCVSAPSKIFTL